MTAGEIIVLSSIALFTIAVILVCLGFDFKKFIKWLFGKKEKKSKPEKKEKTKNDKKEKIKKVKAKKEETNKTKTEEKPQEPEKKPKAFQITKKGVARIHKKAIERDSRSGAIIEQAIKPGQKLDDEQDTKDTDKGYKDFDDLLEKLKDIGDPDELDDDTFKELFLSSAKNKSEGDDSFASSDDLNDDSEFESLESPATGKIDRRLNHFTIDGSHLRLDKNYDDYPSRMPTLDMDHFVFKDRLTGRYDNIKMGDVSNVLQTPINHDDSASQESEKSSDSDEEIFAKIMERRRRELGLDEPSKNNDRDKSGNYLDPTTLIIADAIATPKFKSNKDSN